MIRKVLVDSLSLEDEKPFGRPAEVQQACWISSRNRAINKIIDGLSEKGGNMKVKTRV